MNARKSDAKKVSTEYTTHRKVSYYLGALAGVGLETTLHPLDTIAKRLQHSEKQILLSPRQLNQQFSSLQNIIYPVNTCSIWDGVVAAFTYRAVQRTVMLGSQPIMQKYINDNFGVPIAAFAGSKYQSTVARTVSGALMGTTEVIFLGFDKWKVLRQLGDHTKVSKMASREGANLFAGAGITALRNIKAWGTLYLVDDLVKMHGFNLNSTDQITFKQKLTASFAGSLTAVVISNPTDVVKTGVQKDNLSAVTVAKKIVTQNGLRGFLKGVCPRLFAVTPRLTVVKTASEHLAPLIDHQLDKIQGNRRG